MVVMRLGGFVEADKKKMMGGKREKQNDVC